MAAELFARHHALIGRSVRVEATDRTFASGVLYCIDPESDAVVLLLPSESGEKEKDWGLKVFLGHSVAAIEEDDSGGESLDTIREKLAASTSGRAADADTENERRERLCALLTQVSVATSGYGGSRRNSTRLLTSAETCTELRAVGRRRRGRHRGVRRRCARAPAV